MIDKQKIEEIRNKSDILAVVSEFVKLRKTGKNHIGLCPFHSEKTPSFTVSPDKQLFHCFGCGEGGNVITFLMKIENLSFGEALAELGKKAGVDIGQVATGSLSKGEREKLYDVVLLAAKFFRASLESEVGQPARTYLKQRSVEETTAKSFGLGFAPAGWDNLFKHLIARGVAPALIEKAGLTLPREAQDGFYDRFRERLIFPVFDLKGRVIAFSGRALSNEEPKYLNSPETPIYRKGETVFGLNLTKDNIKKTKTAILVEGNLDLISLFQGGFTNVAAPLGTALTFNQAQLLARFATTVILAFDNDSAGQTAAERSGEILRQAGLKVKTAELQGAKDPDELIRQEGANAFQAVVASAKPQLEYQIKRVIDRHNLAEIEDKARALRAVALLLAREADQFIQSEYAKLAAQLLGVDLATITDETKRLAFYRPTGTKDLRRVTEKPASKLLEAEKKLIALAAQDPEARNTIKAELTPESFLSAEARETAELLLGGIALDPQQLLEQLTSPGTQRFLTNALVSENPDHAREVLHDCIRVIKAENSQLKIRSLKLALHQAEKAGDLERAAALLSALKSEIS